MCVLTEKLLPFHKTQKNTFHIHYNTCSIVLDIHRSHSLPHYSQSIKHFIGLSAAFVGEQHHFSHFSYNLNNLTRSEQVKAKKVMDTRKGGRRGIGMGGEPAPFSCSAI